MNSLLTAHLEQISLCSTSIAELSFPGPKIFTTALLSNPTGNDITSLIRDTEAHERALFHLAPPSTQPIDLAASLPAGGAGRRGTVYGGAGAPPASRGSQPKRSRAVAAVLGGDLYRRTRRAEELSGGNGPARSRQKGEVDVEILLEGAEKLGAV